MKRIISGLLAATMLFLTGCSVNSESKTTSENSYYPITVTDQAGREVVIESEPQRIVSGYYITSSLLIALDLDEKMVGIEDNPQKRPIYSLCNPDLNELQTVGSVKEFDIEACLSTNPDLVIIPMKLRDVADTLEELGLDVIVVNPESHELVNEMAEVVAAATNTVDRGNELTAFINTTKDMLDSVTEGTEPVTVYLGGNSDFLSTAGGGMYQNDMISAAGGINVAGDIDDTYWVETSYEQVLAWNPDYIILAANAEYTVEDVLNDENLAVLDAVINGNVYKLPSDIEAWDSPVPSGILGSVWIANILYPELISDETSEGLIREFYETFYDCEA